MGDRVYGDKDVDGGCGNNGGNGGGGGGGGGDDGTANRGGRRISATQPLDSRQPEPDTHTRRHEIAARKHETFRKDAAAVRIVFDRK